MHKQIFSAFIVYGMLTFLQPLLNFVLQPLFLHYLSETDFAQYALLSNYATLISLLVAFNISSALMAYYPKYAYSTQRANAFVGQIVGFSLRSSLYVLLVMAIVGPFLFAWKFANNQISFYPLGFIATLNGIALALYTPYLIQTNLHQNLSRYAFITLLNVIGGSLLQILLVVGVAGGAFGALLGRTIGLCLPVLYFMVLYRQYWTKKLDIRHLKRPLLFARYTLLNACLDWIAAFGDRFMIERFLLLNSVAAYSLLNIIVGASEMVFYALRTAILPQLYACFEQELKVAPTHANALSPTHKPAALPPQSRSIAQNSLYSFYMAGSMLGLSGVAMLGSNVHWLTTKNAYLQLESYSCLYATGFSASAVTLLVYTRHYYSENSQIVLRYSFFGAVCLLLFNTLLLPAMGLVGAVWSMVAARWATLLLLGISDAEARRILGNKTILLPLIFTALTLLFAYYIKNNPNEFSCIHDNIGLIQCLLVFIFLCFFNQKSVLILFGKLRYKFFLK